MSFAVGLKKMAANLTGASGFGDKGVFIMNDAPADPITGLSSGTNTEVAIEYFREYYEDRELIENRIINGDARLMVVMDTKPKTDWRFKDSAGKVWNIISITPIESQGVDIVYQVHIRK